MFAKEIGKKSKRVNLVFSLGYFFPDAAVLVHP